MKLDMQLFTQVMDGLQLSAGVFDDGDEEKTKLLVSNILWVTL